MAFNNFPLVNSLPYVSKLSEKAAANQLIEHLTTNDLRMPLQSAYKQNHFVMLSWTLALLLTRFETKFF